MTRDPSRPQLLETANSALVDGLRGIPEGVDRINAILPLIQQLADDGDPDFEHMVGAVALEFEKDYEKAYRYLDPAAKACIPPAQRRLGFMLSRGLGVEKDLETAAVLYRQAADAGDAVAKHNLGCMYLFGDGVTASLEEAVRLLEEATADGVDQSANYLADAKRHMEDYDGAREILERIVPEGVATATSARNLAVMCHHGLGGPPDKVKELGCYMKMLDLGDGDGMHQGHTLASEMTVQEIGRAAAWARSDAWTDTLVRHARDR